MINKRLDELKDKTIEMGNLVEKMLKDAFQIQKGKNVWQNIALNEDKLNDLELELEKECIRFIALYQPEATHLRLVLMVLKTTSDLERMGDLAYKIANTFNYLKNKNISEINGDVEHMKEAALKMLKNVLKAFKNSDEKLAQEVWNRDDLVDKLQKKVFNEIKQSLKNDEISEDLSFNKNRIANSVERIADLITNLAENIIYIKTGKVIKHIND